MDMGLDGLREFMMDGEDWHVAVLGSIPMDIVAMDNRHTGILDD